MCLLLADRPQMNNFLQSYNTILGNQNRFDQQENVQRGIARLLRRHNSNNQLCCHDNENNLEVTDVDRYGFVTYVKCTRCQKTMETACYDAKWSYERIYDISQLKPGDQI